MSLARLGALAAGLIAVGLALPTHHGAPPAPAPRQAAHELAPAAATRAGLDAATSAAAACPPRSAFAAWNPERRATRLVVLSADMTLVEVSSIVAAERSGHLSRARVEAADAAVPAAAGQPPCPAP